MLNMRVFVVIAMFVYAYYCGNFGELQRRC